MRNGRMLALLAFGLLIIFFAGADTTARAQGIIVPRPCVRCPRPPRPIPQLPPALPVKSIKIDTKVAAQVATTHVEQVFRNDTDATLEGTYFFPIPESASISEFAIWDGDQRLVGEVRSREEARRIYDEIVRSQRDPGLLEYAGRDLFQASIFPIPPHSDKKLELTYTQVLKADSGTVSYRYPLGTGRNASAVVGAVSGRVELQGREPLRNIYSPTHDIDISRGQEERRAVVSFESKVGQEPQDFQLFYTLTNADFGLTLLTHREPGKHGYFLLTISPKDKLREEEYAAKDIVFVLDTSGSMAAEGKMEKARAALLFGVRSLRDGDRFNVINFAGEEHLMSGGLIAADGAGRARGEEFVKALRPLGGTNINAALLAGMRQFEQSERPRMLVFMTDGLPTVGETNAQRIVDNARQARVAGLRVFTFGVGYDVNTPLLDKIAAENGGVADYIDPKEDIEVKVSNFFSKVSHPVLTAMHLEMGGVETDLVYPREMPDLFRGAQVTIIGRYRNSSDVRGAVLRLTGRAGNESRAYPYEKLNFPSESADNDFLPRLWATRRVGWLMEQVRTNGESQELRDEIVDLGTRYGIVTPYTSYLALESSEATRFITSNTAPDNRPMTTTGGRGSGALARGEASKRSPASPMSAKDGAARAISGADAVRESRRARTQQEAVRLDDDESIRTENDPRSSRRRVGSKTFYLRDGVWLDAEFKEDARLPETALIFGDEEYFALIKREPQLARFFALGERVVVVFKGHVYRVQAAKP
ncbi:MAG TPA: VIT and VWA domain-containing protein [Pyrinomonadaceae bacterium]